ncbi:hypothetical protein BDR06DRAFT_973412 [Suillus hirtellus]|nr:hypothetical protein BDR06DRAFT_973412 [Suillus hirtellus]
MPESSGEILCLPILGQEYTPGTPLITYQFLVNRRTTKFDVREKLRQYGRPVFSNDEKEWLRMPADFSCVPALPKCRWTQVEMVQQTPEVLADMELTGSGSLHKQESFAIRMRRVENNIQSVRDDIYNIEGSINNVTTHVMDVKSLVCRSALSPFHESHVPHQAQPMGQAQAARTTTVVLLLSSQQVSSPLGHLDFRTVPQQSIPSAKLGVALLRDEQFEYDKTQVPEPPTIHLSKDIDRLCEEWESSNLLCVGGCRIPVKYWGEFYKRAKGVKTTAWDALRVEWGNWKFIAEERQCYLDTASFWHASSDGNSKKFSYQQILNSIAEQWTSAAA